jgi:hypothetical protein
VSFILCSSIGLQLQLLGQHLTAELGDNAAGINQTAPTQRPVSVPAAGLVVDQLELPAHGKVLEHEDLML